MTVKHQLMKELEDLPVDAQEKVLKLVHFVKKEMLISHGKRSPLKKGNALLEIDEIAIETGIPDLARQHDHYLYGVSKK